MNLFTSIYSIYHVSIIYLSLDLSIYLSIHPGQAVGCPGKKSTYYLSIYLSTYLSIYLSIYLSGIRLMIRWTRHAWMNWSMPFISSLIWDWMAYTHGINLTKQDSQEAIRRLQQEQEPSFAFKLRTISHIAMSCLHCEDFVFVGILEQWELSMWILSLPHRSIHPPGSSFNNFLNCHCHFNCQIQMHPAREAREI